MGAIGRKWSRYAGFKTGWIAAAVLLATAPAGASDAHQDWLFFTSVDTFNNRWSDPTPGSGDSWVRPSVDVLYTASSDRFRFLGEYLWSSTESEMERLKVGWQSGENSMLWFGRFHTTSKFWTSEYHHGQFLQTAITRPNVEEWEDESGPMPSHFTGFSFEHEMETAGEGALNWALAVGLAPNFVGEELAAFDVLEPDSGHDLGLNLRLAFRPKLLNMNQFGVLMGWSDINVASESSPNLANLEQIEQWTASFFGDWRWDDWRLIANLVYFHNTLDYLDRSENDKFGVGYLQFEYAADEKWTIFGRSAS